MARHTDYWRKLPTWWIEHENCLPEFKWCSGGSGANEIAALMCLVLLVHTSESADKDVRITYNEFMEILSLSRAKVAKGLEKIHEWSGIPKNDVKTASSLCKRLGNPTLRR